MWGLVYSRRKGSVQEGTHCVGAPHDSASLITGNIQNTEVRGLVDTRRKRACQEGTHGIGTPHGSASFSKGNIQNTEDSEDSVAVASVVPEAGDTAFQIHCLRRSAYAAVLRAFCAQSDLFSRVKQECLAELRKELTISDNEHREYVVKASTNKHIKSLNAWLYEGNNGNADAVKESVDLKRVVPDSGDSAFQIHCLERSAYAFVLRAFYAKPNLLSWARLLTKLRNELRLSYIEHREVIARVNSNNYIKSLRKFRLANYSGLTEKTPAFDLIAVGPDKISKTGQSFTSLAPESPMPAHMMSPARNIGILGTSYSTRKGLCSDPDTIAPVKKLKSGSGSALAYFKSLPCAEQLPEPIFSVLMVEELFKAKPDPSNLETVESILKDQGRYLMDALAKLSEVLSAYPGEHDVVECDEEAPPPKSVSSSSYDETPTSSIPQLWRAEAEREVVETRRELEPAAKRAWRPNMRVLGSEWVECLSRKRKKGTGLVSNTMRRMRPLGACY